MGEIERVHSLSHEHNTLYKVEHEPVYVPPLEVQQRADTLADLKKDISDKQIKSLLSLLENQGIIFEGINEQEKIEKLKQAIAESDINEPELLELLDLAEQENQLRQAKQQESSSLEGSGIVKTETVVVSHKKPAELSHEEYKAKMDKMFAASSAQESEDVSIANGQGNGQGVKVSDQKMSFQKLTDSSKAFIAESMQKTKEATTEATTYLKEDRSHDGKFSGIEAAKQFGKGITFPLTYAFSSIKNLLTATGLLFVGHRLSKMGGGPLLSALGTTFAAITLFRGGKKLVTAQNGDDTEKAFYDLGMGTVGLYGIGTAKPALKGIGIEHKGSSLSAAVRTYREIPRSLKVMGQNSKLMLQKMYSALKVFVKTPSSIKNARVFSKTAPPLPVPNPVGLNLNLAADKKQPPL